MNKRLLMLWFVIILLMSFIAAGCSSNKSETSRDPNAASAYMTIKDNAGRTVTISKKPERIVLLSTSFVDLLYSVDGKAAGRPNSKTDSIPNLALSVPEVGFVYNINLEKVAALKPDLVVGVQGMHEKLVPGLESSHIPVIILRYKTIQDTYETIR